MSQNLGTYRKRIMGDIPKKATDNVLQEPSGLLFDELVHHVAQNSPNSIEALVGRANVVQSMVIKKDLLHDENGDSLAQFGAGLHDGHSGIISVVRRKLMTSELSFLTRAPMTPREVRRRYSNGRDLEVVFRNGYKNSGI
jgi:hypothetical protein